MKLTTTRTPVMLVLLALAILLMAKTAEFSFVDSFSHAARAPMSIDDTTSAEGAKSLPGSSRDMRSWLNNRVVAGNEHGDKLKAPLAGNEHGDKLKAPLAGNEHGDRWQKALEHMG